MSATSVAFNPAATTNAAGLFNVQAQGLIQGTYFDDPATRFALSGGVLASTETLAMFGGVGIGEYIPASGLDVRGSQIKRATAQANLTGFSVFNQNGAAVNSPQSQVPVTLLGGQVNFFRFGSGAKLALAIDPTLVTDDGGLITAQVSWDYTNQRIVAYDTVAALPIKILSIQTAQAMTVGYTTGTSVASWVTSGNACAIVII
jgi:hypothetical protein